MSRQYFANNGSTNVLRQHYHPPASEPVTRKSADPIIGWIDDSSADHFYPSDSNGAVHYRAHQARRQGILRRSGMEQQYHQPMSYSVLWGTPPARRSYRYSDAAQVEERGVRTYHDYFYGGNGNRSPSSSPSIWGTTGRRRNVSFSGGRCSGGWVEGEGEGEGEEHGVGPPQWDPSEREMAAAKWVSRSQPSLMRHPLPHPLSSIQEERKNCVVSPREVSVSLRSESIMTTSLPNGDIMENNNHHSDKDILKNNINRDNSHKINGTYAFDEDDVVYDEKGRILSGSLRALIKKLTPTKDYFPDKSFILAFLLNARSFMAPKDILHQILQQCIFEQNSASDNFKRDSRLRFYNNVVRLVREWTETFPWDFRDSSMMERVKQLSELNSSSDQQYQKLIQNLTSKLSKLDRYEKALANLQKEASSDRIFPSQTLNSTLLCNSPITVAQQLTHIELERLSMIGPEEFSSRLAKDFIAQTNGITRPRARNIEHYVDWFNRLTYLIATDICKHLKKKHRAEVIEFFIDVAKECFNIGNFNSLMAIVAGLNMNPIARLRKTWARVDTVKLEILQHQLDPSSNFTSYRATLKAAVWRSEGAKKECERIVVPFFSLFVKDLLIVYQKVSTRLPNGHLNFGMFTQFASQIREFMAWKQVYCPFERDSSLLQYILTSPVFSDKSLQLASYECEPPDLPREKELQKQLKLELSWSR